MKRIVNAFRNLNWGKRAYAVVVLCTATAIALPAQTLDTIYSFCSKGGTDCTDGWQSWAGLVQATNGDLYGTTIYGGNSGCSFGCGTVFKITPGGALTTLHSFDGTDGGNPAAGLVQAVDGDFYGTTYGGGANGSGTVFKMTPSGQLATLYSFCSRSGCADGKEPYAALVQAANGDLYGTTADGGAHGNYGTVFKITPSGTFTTLYNFCSQNECTDGAYPVAGVVLAADRDFYGTTCGGGVNGGGTVFKITPSGLTTLYSFCAPGDDLCGDGQVPQASLVQATNGDLYGTTSGESSCDNSPYLGPSGASTVFKITPSGTLTTLYTFCPQSGCTDGNNSTKPLIQATNGDLYGTTNNGGASNDGTVFQITPSGVLTTLYSFCSQTDCRDGAYPTALVQDTNGDLYGTTVTGGSGTPSCCGPGGGTVFSLSIGLGPFVRARPFYGMVGAPVKILGSDLTGATSVTFNGTAATFTVVSSSLITTTVPTGATTGKVQVVTPNGTLSSNIAFRVP
jgi:uncharacterized repeat protein (TIGR03803 family)